MLLHRRAKIGAGGLMACCWLSSGTPILHVAQYAPRDRVSWKPRSPCRSVITVSGIIEPPHCMHSIARFPSVPDPERGYSIIRTQQEQTGRSNTEVPHCGSTATSHPETKAALWPIRAHWDWRPTTRAITVSRAGTGPTIIRAMARLLRCSSMRDRARSMHTARSIQNVTDLAQAGRSAIACPAKRPD